MTYTDLETGKVMESYQYSYDKNSNITKKTQVNNYPKEDADKVNETKVYTYDTLGRLTKTVITDHKKDDKTKTVTYTYDNVGNRLKEDDGTTIKITSRNFRMTKQVAIESGKEFLKGAAKTAVITGARRVIKFCMKHFSKK